MSVACDEPCEWVEAADEPTPSDASGPRSELGVRENRLDDRFQAELDALCLICCAGVSCGGCGCCCWSWTGSPLAGSARASSLTTVAASIAFWSRAAFCAASLSAQASRRRCSMSASADGCGPAVKAVVNARNQPEPAAAGPFEAFDGAGSTSGSLADGATATATVALDGSAAGAALVDGTDSSIEAAAGSSRAGGAGSVAAPLQPQPNQLAREAD